jgi:UPF0176 protein
LQKSRYIERQKQIKLAEQRGEEHIGGDVAKFADEHRQAKSDFKKSQNETSKKTA